MLLQIPSVLTKEQVFECRRIIDKEKWVDGKVTAGHQSGKTKNNLQLPETHSKAKRMGDLILASLEKTPLFMSAALPLKVFPPLFNRYDEGQSFGNHVDNSIRQIATTGQRIRTDLSATLFLTEPDDYDGGELVIEDVYGIHSVKLPAGDMILYPSTSLHNVRQITRGSRVSSFFWIQSMIRDDGERTILFDLDSSIQRLSSEAPNHPSVMQLTSVYHNLLRRWAEV